MSANSGDESDGIEVIESSDDEIEVVYEKVKSVDAIVVEKLASMSHSVKMESKPIPNLEDHMKILRNKSLETPTCNSRRQSLRIFQREQLRKNDQTDDSDEDIVTINDEIRPSKRSKNRRAKEKIRVNSPKAVSKTPTRKWHDCTENDVESIISDAPSEEVVVGLQYQDDRKKQRCNSKGRYEQSKANNKRSKQNTSIFSDVKSINSDASPEEITLDDDSDEPSAEANPELPLSDETGIVVGKTYEVTELLKDVDKELINIWNSDRKGSLRQSTKMQSYAQVIETQRIRETEEMKKAKEKNRRSHSNGDKFKRLRNRKGPFPSIKQMRVCLPPDGRRAKKPDQQGSNDAVLGKQMVAGGRTSGTKRKASEDDLRTWENEKAKFKDLFPAKKPRGDGAKKVTTPLIVKEIANSGADIEPSSDEALVREIAREVEAAIADGVPPEISTPTAELPNRVEPGSKPIFRIVSGGEKCKFCGFVCDDRSTSLRQHMDDQHRYRCETCVISYKDAKLLGAHRQKHKTRYSCGVCEKDVGSERQYRRHEKSSMHQRLLYAQTKAGNGFLESFRSSGDVQLIDVSGGQSKVQEFLKANVKNNFPPPNGGVQVLESDLVIYVREQLERLLVGRFGGISPPDWHSSACSDTTSVNSAPSTSRAMYEAGTRNTRDFSGPTVSRDEVMQQGMKKTMDLFMQALDAAREDVADQAYGLGIVDRPVPTLGGAVFDDIPTSELTADDLDVLQNIAVYNQQQKLLAGGVTAPIELNANPLNEFGNDHGTELPGFDADLGFPMGDGTFDGADDFREYMTL